MLVAVVAQWRSIGTVNPRHWIQFLVAPVSFKPFAISKIVMTTLGLELDLRCLISP